MAGSIGNSTAWEWADIQNAAWHNDAPYHKHLAQEMVVAQPKSGIDVQFVLSISQAMAQPIATAQVNDCSVGDLTDCI
jgi:hypothetical protein